MIQTILAVLWCIGMVACFLIIAKCVWDTHREVREMKRWRGR